MMSGTSPLLEERESSPESEATRKAERSTSVKFPLHQSPSFLLHDLILAAKQDDISALKILHSVIREPARMRLKSLRKKGVTQGGADAVFPYSSTSMPHLGDLEDTEGWTPLHSACEARSPLSVAYLLTAGCSPNKPADSHYGGFTPMHMACLGGHTDLLSTMIQFGGTLLSPASTSGLIPIDMASFTSFPSVGLIKIIKKHTGICIHYDSLDDLSIGPNLTAGMYYCIHLSKETGLYSISEEDEFQDKVFPSEQMWPSPYKTAAEAAHAVVDLAAPGQHAGNRATQLFLDPEADGSFCALSPTELSESLIELTINRESYMASPQRAGRILSSVVEEEKENSKPKVVAETIQEEEKPRHVAPNNGEKEAQSPKKAIPASTSNEPTVQTKRARFAPGIESPASGRTLPRRSRLGYSGKQSRPALSDITPPHAATPTRNVVSLKPPTPYPEQDQKPIVLKKLEALQFDSAAEASMEKENRHATARMKLDFSVKRQPKGQGKSYRRVPHT